ncbi:MAG: thioredoxin family protein [Saprospiraceae bacterium]|nr:thioredoxin family protein [Saprospiraceae bacterium]
MLKIEIIGTEDSKQKQLARHVQQAIDASRIDANVKTVSNWEEIVAYRIIRTPALVIRNQVLSQGFVPSVAEIQSLLSSFIYDKNQLVL